nr:hypothetical protein [Streptomyces antimicrobicus]
MSVGGQAGVRAGTGQHRAEAVRSDGGPDASGVGGEGEAGVGEDLALALGEFGQGDAVEVDAASGRGGGHDHGRGLDPVPGDRELAALDPVGAVEVEAFVVPGGPHAALGEESQGFGDLGLDARAGDEGLPRDPGGQEHGGDRRAEGGHVGGGDVHAERVQAAAGRDSGADGAAVLVDADLGAGGLHRGEVAVDQAGAEGVPARSGEVEQSGAGEDSGGQDRGSADPHSLLSRVRAVRGARPQSPPGDQGVSTVAGAPGQAVNA